MPLEGIQAEMYEDVFSFLEASGVEEKRARLFALIFAKNLKVEKDGSVGDVRKQLAQAMEEFNRRIREEME